MPRKCTICSHPKSKEIDGLIVGKAVYGVIAQNFGVSADAVGKHAKNHLQPLIAQANEESQEAIKDKIKAYRAEVNYPILDKSKLLQDKILGDLDEASEISERVALYREFRGSLQEEAKLTGAYQKEKENVDELSQIKRFIQERAEAKGISYQAELKNYVERFAKPEFKERLVSELEN